jgi:hypothetical protein
MGDKVSKIKWKERRGGKVSSYKNKVCVAKE